MDKIAIEQKVRELHRHIWENKETLWPQGAPEPINMLHPRIGAHVAGLTYEEIDKFSGQPFTQRKVGMKFAGQLDRARKSIVVAREFGPETARFTGAHELGHYFLHQGEGMFRDRPTNYGAAGGSRNIAEQEADYYGACYIMPARLVIDEFEFRFGPSPLTFDTNIAFHLNPTEVDNLVGAEEQQTNREFELAKCTRFAGRHFHSLAQQFCVSNTAMAIRLKELGLVRWP